MKQYLIATFILLGLTSQAKWNRFTYQTVVGASFYQGDIGSTTPDIPSIKYNVKGGFNFRIYKFFGLHYHVSYTLLHHSDLYSEDQSKKERGIFFQTDILHSGIHLSLNQFLSPRTKIIHYFFTGLDGAMMYVQMEKRGGRTPLVAEGNYGNFQIFGLAGLGLGYRVSKRVGIVSEFTYYLTNTDYLDGTSYNGTPQNKDSFINYNLMLTIRLGKIKRPRRPSFNSRRYRFHRFEIPAVYDWN